MTVVLTLQFCSRCSPFNWARKWPFSIHSEYLLLAHETHKNIWIQPNALTQRGWRNHWANKFDFNSRAYPSPRQLRVSLSETNTIQLNSGVNIEDKFTAMEQTRTGLRMGQWFVCWRQIGANYAAIENYLNQHNYSWCMRKFMHNILSSIHMVVNEKFHKIYAHSVFSGLLSQCVMKVHL